VTALRACIVVAGAHDTSYGKTASTTLEGVIIEAIHATIPGMKIFNATSKRNGADGDIES